MFNLLKRAINQKMVNYKAVSTQSPQLASLSELPINSFITAYSADKRMDLTTNTHLASFQLKNRLRRNQEWLDSLEVTTRAEVIDFRFSVEKLAEEMTLSRSQLFRKVKDLLGISPSQFIRGIRLEKAKELLESGAIASVKATAFEVGLKDVVHFSRLFKEKFGFSPSEYI